MVTHCKVYLCEAEDDDTSSDEGSESCCSDLSGGQPDVPFFGAAKPKRHAGRSGRNPCDSADAPAPAHDWLADSSSRYSLEDLKRAQNHVRKATDLLTEDARVRSYPHARPFGQLTPAQADFVRWALYCVKASVSGRRLDPQLIDVDGSARTGKSVAT